MPMITKKGKHMQPDCVIVEESKIPTISEIKDVPTDDLLTIFKVCQGLERLCERENGIGISAVQAGIPLKLFLVKGSGRNPLIPAGKYGYFANCSYEPVSEEKVVSLEGCLSLRSPDGRLRSFQVERYSQIRLRGLLLNYTNDLKFEDIDCVVDLRGDGIVFQHEADHHSGVLISQIGRELDVW